MTSIMASGKLKLTLSLLGILLASSIIVLFGFLSAIPQDPAYHNFAPTTLKNSHIPNTLNVLTNIPLAIIGLYGLCFCLRIRQTFATLSWSYFFVGVTLTSIGSAVYHWNPNNANLVWDRIPMTIAFGSLFVALLSEMIDPNLEKFLLGPLVIFGISSVVYWHYSDDLRIYALVQFFPLVALSLLVVIMPERSQSGHFLAWALMFYIVAKIFEFHDHETRQLIGLSGHALKHLLTSGSAISILWMLKKRQPMTTEG